MPRRITPRQPWQWLTSLIALLIISFAQSGRTQSFDGSQLSVPAKLDMKWLVCSGDDPSYARPGFDDSHWTVYDPYTSVEMLFPQRPSVIWYRLHVNVGPEAKGLALSEIDISQAFEIYVNGERLIAVGQVSPWIAYTSGARVLARIPDQLSATGALVIALRVHLSPVEWHGQFPGYYPSNLMLGQEETLYRNDWLAIIGENALDWFDRLLVIGLGFIALVLFASQRRQTVYLWIFAVGALVLVKFPIPIITTFRNIPVIWAIIGNLPRRASPFIWVSLYFAFVHQKVGWVWRAILIFAGILDTINGLQQWILPLSLPLQLFTNLPFVTLLSVVVPIVLILHWRRGNREAGILLIPVILFSLYIYAEVGFDVLFQFPTWRQAALRGLNLIDRFPAGPFTVSLQNVAGILSTLTLAIIMLQRSTTMSRRQAQLESELAAAQQVQQVLVPEHTGEVTGFIVESVYLPAQQVGGDFFQILPSGDGGLLVVVGDVAGKGLPAAMLVSVLVGALRAVAEYTTRPAEILANLNERLVGRAGGGFSTALVALIAANGQGTIANAGHLSPYLDGKEVELPGALPLGVTSAATYEITEFYLPAGGRLTFYSDGVVEAQNAKGELFGFERAHELSTHPAAAIVDAAKRFGQEDDITVVTIERATAIASAA
jgi:sigma-B regulation protein RsbU (phosphoserine phosphatase)